MRATMPRKQNLSFAGRVNRLIAVASVITGLLFALACNSSSGFKGTAEKTAKQRSSKAEQNASSQSDPDPGIDLNCVYEHLQNPPESFRYVYTKQDSDGFNVDQEADVTPQAIDGLRKPEGDQQPLHAVRSDPSSWQQALASLTGISGMSGTVATFNHSSAMKRESGGAVNGYQTIHYSVDTARWDETTRQMLGNFTLGPGGFVKGDVWVTPSGCPVKLVLDDEMHKKDGSLLDKVHYEEAMVKK